MKTSSYIKFVFIEKLKNSLNYKMELPEIDLTEPLLNLVNYIAVSIKNKNNKIFQKILTLKLVKYCKNYND